MAIAVYLPHSFQMRVLHFLCLCLNSNHLIKSELWAHPKVDCQDNLAQQVSAYKGQIQECSIHNHSLLSQIKNILNYRLSYVNVNLFILSHPKVLVTQCLNTLGSNVVHSVFVMPIDCHIEDSFLVSSGFMSLIEIYFEINLVFFGTFSSTVEGFMYFHCYHK